MPVLPMGSVTSLLPPRSASLSVTTTILAWIALVSTQNLLLVAEDITAEAGREETWGVRPWCEGAFPSDLEDVTISPKNSNQPSPFSSTSNPVFLEAQGQSGSQLNGLSNVEVASSSCSPPSVGDLTSLNPQDHFDPDFDVVDDIKFIDCLIQTMPQDEARKDVEEEENNIPPADNHEDDINGYSSGNGSGAGSARSAIDHSQERKSKGDIYQLQPSVFPIGQHQGTYHPPPIQNLTPQGKCTRSICWD